MKRFIILVAILFAFLSHGEIEKKGSLYDADFRDQTLEQALVELSKKSHIKIQASATVNLSQPVLLGFSETSIEKILNDLLEDYNFVAIRDPKTKQIKSIRIFDSKTVALSKKKKQTNKPTKKQAVANKNPAELHLKKQANGFHLPIKVNGRQTTMLVDTGATHLSISGALAKQLNLLGDNQVAVKTAAGNTTAKTVVIQSIEINGKVLKNTPAVILPNLHENGLVGQNILKHFKQVTNGDEMILTTID